MPKCVDNIKEILQHGTSQGTPYRINPKDLGTDFLARRLALLREELESRVKGWANSSHISQVATLGKGFLCSHHHQMSSKGDTVCRPTYSSIASVSLLHIGSTIPHWAEALPASVMQGKKNSSSLLIRRKF